MELTGEFKKDFMSWLADNYSNDMPHRTNQPLPSEKDSGIKIAEIWYTALPAPARYGMIYEWLNFANTTREELAAKKMLIYNKIN